MYRFRPPRLLVLLLASLGLFALAACSGSGPTAPDLSALGPDLPHADLGFPEAMRLGLTESRFANPHGLGGNEHVTSAYDLAMLSRYGMSLPGFREIVTAPSWLARGSRTIPLANINSFLNQYQGADGIKTGYTRRAGRTLASSATRNGHRLYAVVLNSPTREEDARKLLNWAFTNLTWDY